MKNLATILSMAILALLGCSRSPTDGAAAQKISGPPIRSLNHDQLMATYRECHQFGSVDDSRVKYTIPYCASVDTAQSAEGWVTPNTAKVDPKLNKLH